MRRKANLEAKVGREESKVRFLSEGDETIIDITSEFGIDNATIRRKSEEWPKSILVRLHLSGLESFDCPSMRIVGLTAVSIVGGNEKIPLKEGYFEVHMPAKLFEGNPEELTLRWVDFYQN